MPDLTENQKKPLTDEEFHRYVHEYIEKNPQPEYVLILKDDEINEAIMGKPLRK